MEHIVNLRKGRRKLQLVWHFSTPFQNSEWANIARSKFALDPEAVSTLHWCDSKISLIARLIDHVFMMTVILTLLKRLSSLEILTNNADLFFGMLDNIRTKEWTFPSF